MGKQRYCSHLRILIFQGLLFLYRKPQLLEECRSHQKDALTESVPIIASQNQSARERRWRSRKKEMVLKGESHAASSPPSTISPHEESIALGPEPESSLTEIIRPTRTTVPIKDIKSWVVDASSGLLVISLIVDSKAKYSRFEINWFVLNLLERAAKASQIHEIMLKVSRTKALVRISRLLQSAR